MDLFFIAPENREDWYRHGKLQKGKMIGQYKIWDICYDSWEDTTFNIRIIDDGDGINNILKDFFDKEVINVLNELPKIYKIDLVKYIILGQNGGGYSDMDVELVTDFSHLISDRKIYINSRGKSLQNSLIFSPKDDVWFDIANYAKRKIIRNHKGIKRITKEFLNRAYSKKNKTYNKLIRLKYEKAVSNNVGSLMLKSFFDKNKYWGKVVKLPEFYFNDSFKNEFPFTKHYATGHWRIPQKIN